jgi:glycosyltransferase involved in cell wall biosynthesis
VTGWLVPAGDPVALAETLARALKAPSTQLEEMGRSGAAAVRAAHDARREAGKLVGLFAAAIGRAPPGTREEK